MKHIVLAGDSIFDNAIYVEEGESVDELLKHRLPKDKITLIAVDGDVITDVKAQLKNYPNDATHLFISCGGNDALQSAEILSEEAVTVSEACYKLLPTLTLFRANYANMLDELMVYSSKLTACTIYNKSPSVPEEALTALQLFNEIIMEEVFKRNLPLIDLRIVCDAVEDYSVISPIEPSYEGGKKITSRIARVCKEHDFKQRHSIIFI